MSEQDFRRGFTHGLECAFMLMERHDIKGDYRTDMANACNIALEYRNNQRESHPCFLDDVMKAVIDKRVNRTQ